MKIKKMMPLGIGIFVLALLIIGVSTFFLLVIFVSPSPSIIDLTNVACHNKTLFFTLQYKEGKRMLDVKKDIRVLVNSTILSARCEKVLIEPSEFSTCLVTSGLGKVNDVLVVGPGNGLRKIVRCD